MDHRRHRCGLTLTKPMPPTLLDKMAMLSRQFDASEVGHAFGGGLVLPIYGQIRATDDIDVGVFVGVDRSDAVFDVLGRLGIDVDFLPSDREKIRTGGWVTVGYGDTPVDVFFATSPMHMESVERVHRVALGPAEIPVLGVEDFVAHKVLFGRPQDWSDIDSILAAQSGFDSDIVGRWLNAEGEGREVRRRARCFNALAVKHGAPPIRTPPRFPQLAGWWKAHAASGHDSPHDGTTRRSRQRPAPTASRVWVHPHRRSNGTWVRGHWRTR